VVSLLGWPRLATEPRATLETPEVRIPRYSPASTVAIFGASDCRADDPAYAEAVRCGRLLAEAGLAVATGGYGGLMEAVSQGAREAGGVVIGVTAPSVFPHREGANRFVSEERRAGSLTERIHELMQADAAIALPGSIGTLTELMVAWNLAYVAQYGHGSPKPVVAVGGRWRGVIDQLEDELETEAGLVLCVESVDEAVANILVRLRLPL